MTEITIAESEEEFEPPSYKDKGNITVEIVGKYEEKYHEGEWIVERFSYDASASPFWINEGVGVDYFINSWVVDEIPGEGIWTIENIHGEYIKGDWGFTDDDEDWDWDLIRPATQEEIDNL